MTRLETDRLVLRRWEAGDLEPFAAMNRDPEVMAHLPKLLSREESDAFARRIEAGFEEHGFGLWAVEIPSVAGFVGFVGLAVPSFEASFTPAVEVGWRLARRHWGNGYATEAAREALRFGFEDAGLPEVLSWTVPANRASWRVMERIGMTHDPADDFDHPRFPPPHPLCRHVLYRIAAERWRVAAGGE